MPFEGDTPFTIGVKHKSERPRNPRELNTQLPEDLSRVILRCLEKDKAKRYQTAAELRADLEKVEQGLPTTERVIAPKKSFTSREITVKFNLRKLAVPSLTPGVIAVIQTFGDRINFHPLCGAPHKGWKLIKSALTNALN